MNRGNCFSRQDADLGGRADPLRRQALYPTELRTPSERLKLARGGWAPTRETALSSERRW